MSVVVAAGENKPYKMYLRVHSAQNISTLTQGSYCKLYLGDTVMVGGSSANKGGPLANLLHSDAHHDPGASMAHVTFRTKVHHSQQKSNPVWNEKFEVGIIDPSTEILSIRVKSQQMLYCPSVGACAIPLKQLKLGESVDQSVPLYKGHKPAGHIRLQILLTKNTVASPSYTAPQFQFRAQQSFQQQQLQPQQSFQPQQSHSSPQQQQQYESQPSLHDHEAMEQRALDLLSEKHKQEQILLQKQQRLAEAQARELEIERNRRIAVEKELERLRRMSSEPNNVVQNLRSNSTPPNYYGVVQDEQELSLLRRQSVEWKQARSNSVAPKSYNHGLAQEDLALSRLRRMSSARSNSQNARSSTPKAFNGIEQDNQTAHLVSAFANTKLQSENVNPQQWQGSPAVLPSKTIVPAPKGWDDAPPPPSYEMTVSSTDLPPPSYNETASTSSRISTPSKTSRDARSVYSDVVHDALPSDESSDSSSEEQRRQRRKEKKKRRRAKKKAKKLKRKMKREERKMRKKFGLDSGAEELSESDSDSDSSSSSSSLSSSTSSGESRRRRLKNKHQQLDRARAASSSAASRHSSRRPSTPRKKSSRSVSSASDYQAEPSYQDSNTRGYSQPKWEISGYIVSDDEQADLPCPTQLQSAPSNDARSQLSYQVSNMPLSESTNVASNMNPPPAYNSSSNVVLVDTDAFDETAVLPPMTNSYSNMMMSFHSEASSDADREFHVPAIVPGGHKRYSTQEDFLDSQRTYDDDNTIGFAEIEEDKMDSNLQHSNSLDIDELIKQHQEEFGQDDSTDSITSAPGGGFFGAISPAGDGAAFFVEPSHYSREAERSANDTSNNSFCF